jgi:hypothetical protein
MGDPIITGMMIGAAGGALTNKNPIQGAMMGGALGAAGGAFTGGAMGAANPTIGSFSPNLMSMGSNAPGAIIQSAGAAPTFMQQLTGGAMGVKDAFSGANTFMNKNPFTAQAGMSLAKSAFEPEQPMPYAPQGQIRQGQVQPMDYMSLLNPQQQSVIRPPQISLLG